MSRGFLSASCNDLQFNYSAIVNLIYNDVSVPLEVVDILYANL
jgi:hypothetical protein